MKRVRVVSSRSAALRYSVALAALVLYCPAHSPAQTAPSSDVRDEVGLFSRDAVAKAREHLVRLERTYQVPSVIETINSLDGAGLEETAVERARKAGALGIFVLIVKREAKISTIREERFAALFESRQLDAVRDAFIADFKKQEFDAGLQHGVAAIEKVLADAKAAGRTPAAGSSRPLVLRNQYRLTLEGAKTIIAGAQAKALEMGLAVNIAVVDDGGHMIAFERADGARPASGYTATTKAVTAATFRRATGPLKPGENENEVLLNLSLQNAAAASGGRLTTLHGGVPVMLDGQVIGGVGVGGGKGEEDAQVARAGIASFMTHVEGQGKSGHAEPARTKE
jgi:glc operon protein GlcG